ncbi:hypothetical protein [Cytophaga hutchinsonii]|uniref:Uncharacterized protein n=1 Tax=Cytophaga hutchinsonii (strain ATCC 33406 / DSM 1761 / CIP 103989 / NBRC 15051 / NCIMB 9469 / D465) TaxID=269798 RepID=A0A6N4SVW1_CYTH3|nr:hypothetical protein [Cytophaga hutchinsonii]ABG60742.1 hypothetical protein CHU_3509 [Cytophaga hutchinsonii ATCC 33406]SFX70928.1 hypothetical protein SAMN04487930_10867 [Cytophaga hutchinsonii ATCC 33406]
MAITTNEKVLSVCTLRYDKNNTSKNNICTLTPTKLYIARGENVKSISLQDISSIEYSKKINWKLIGIGIAVLLFAFANHVLGLFPAQSESLNELLLDEEFRKAAMEWNESNNQISMAITMIAGIFLYFGFKKKSFIHIITNRENLYLRVYIFTEEYESFVNMLNDKIGYVGVPS